MITPSTPSSSSGTGSEHIVQLFDTPETLGDAVAGFLRDGFERGEHGIVIARTVHVRAIADCLARDGGSIARWIEDGQLTVLDAASAARSLTSHGATHPARFDRSVARLVRQLAASSRGLRIYGEIVDLLAEEDNFPAACALETLWNQLASDVTFTLLCGYASAHFAAPNGGSALRSICRQHGRVARHPDDLLGNWLLGHQQTH